MPRHHGAVAAGQQRGRSGADFEPLDEIGVLSGIEHDHAGVWPLATQLLDSGAARDAQRCGEDHPGKRSATQHGLGEAVDGAGALQKNGALRPQSFGECEREQRCNNNEEARVNEHQLRQNIDRPPVAQQAASREVHLTTNAQPRRSGKPSKHRNYEHERPAEEVP